jgi:hypothetical protein
MNKSEGGTPTVGEVVASLRGDGPPWVPKNMRVAADMLEAAQEKYADAQRLLGELSAENAALRQSIAQVEKDARKYHWLRDKSEPGICAFYLSVGEAFHKIRFKPETVDDAIDDALLKTEGK